PWMQGGHVSLPAPYLDVKGATFELPTRDQCSRLLGTVESLLAYGRGDHLRGYDLDTSPCELLTHLCREGISDGDASRTVRIGMQKRGAFDQQRVACPIVWRQHRDCPGRCRQRWRAGRQGTTEGEDWQQQQQETSRYHRGPPGELVIALRRCS